MKEYFIDNVGDQGQIKNKQLICFFFFPLNEELRQHVQVSLIFELKVTEK